jgi:hypothetical protein
MQRLFMIVVALVVWWNWGSIRESLLTQGRAQWQMAVHQLEDSLLREADKTASPSLPTSAEADHHARRPSPFPSVEQPGYSDQEQEPGTASDDRMEDPAGDTVLSSPDDSPEL